MKPKPKTRPSRQIIIDEMVNQMRAVQIISTRQNPFEKPIYIERKKSHIGVWKGGC
jgi:hypothetical protein